jgi:uncharacterized protein YecE (DUF72 family)
MWRGDFYPPKLRQKDELNYASRKMDAIEINGSFYSLQRPENYSDWYQATPDGFRFSVKGSRYITHMKRLRNIRAPLANFLASGVLRLEDKLGPFLWQFPPNFNFNGEVFQNFFDMLPRDTKSASRIARKHDSRVSGRASMSVSKNRPLQHCVEIRHESFRSPEFIELLKENDIGLVVADTAGKCPYMEDITSKLVYIRLHGDKEIYKSGYTPEALKKWAQKIRRWRRDSHDVYVFFDNDIKVRAPYDAMALRKLVD